MLDKAIDNTVKSIVQETEKAKAQITRLVEEYNKIDTQRAQIRQEISKLEGTIIGYNNTLTIVQTNGQNFSISPKDAENSNTDNMELA